MSSRNFLLTPDILLQAYASGIFPMAESAKSRELRWFDPPLRAIIPLDNRFHIPRRLRKTIRRFPYKIQLNMAFSKVIRACAKTGPGRTETWINRDIISIYNSLHLRGFAHSVEAWDGHDLVGGLYGVSLGSAFFGESMFSRKTDSSKIALVYLVALLRELGFTLLDTQFQTDHLAQFGTFEVTRANYKHLLSKSLENKIRFEVPPEKDWDQLVLSLLQPVIHKS